MCIRVAKEMKRKLLSSARESRSASEALEQKSNTAGGTRQKQSERHRPGPGGRQQETALPKRQGGRGRLPDFGTEVLTPAPAENP